MQRHPFPYHWIAKDAIIICLVLRKLPTNLHVLALSGPEFCNCLKVEQRLLLEVEKETQDVRACAWLRDNPGNKVGNLPTLFRGVSLALPGVVTSGTNTIPVLELEDGIHWVINYNHDLV